MYNRLAGNYVDSSESRTTISIPVRNDRYDNYHADTMTLQHIHNSGYTENQKKLILQALHDQFGLLSKGTDYFLYG